MKIISLSIFAFVASVSFAQDKTPVLSEMGSLKQESAQENPATLTEQETVVIENNSQKRNKASRRNRKTAIADAKKAEALEE